MIKYVIVSADEGIYLGGDEDAALWSKSEEFISEAAQVFATEKEARTHAATLGIESASTTYAFCPVDTGRRSLYATAEQLFDAGLRSQLGHLVTVIREEFMWEKDGYHYRQQLAPSTVEELLTSTAPYVNVSEEDETWYVASGYPGKSYGRLHEGLEAGQRIVDKSYEEMESNIAGSLGIDTDEWHLFITGKNISVISKNDGRVSINFSPDEGGIWTVNLDNNSPDTTLETWYDFDNALDMAEVVVAELDEGKDAGIPLP